MWARQEKIFVEGIRDATNTEEVKDAVVAYKPYKNSLQIGFHSAVIKLFKKKLTGKEFKKKDNEKNHAEGLEALQVMFKQYSVFYKKPNSLKQKLTEVRTKSIEKFQSADFYKMSKLDKYFNISNAKRIKIVNDYKEQVRKKNKNKIQVDVKHIVDMTTHLIQSKNVYDRLISLMICTGARPIEIFDKNEFELIPDRPAWIKVLNLAKKRDTQEKQYAIRPVIILPPQAVIDELRNIRNHFKKKHAVIIDKSGGLAKDKSQTLNKQVVKHFPDLVKNIHQKSSILRKVYADLSYKNFADKTKTNFNTWVADVLGHGDLLTSFSYSYVNVRDPNQVRDDEFKTQLEELRGKLDLLLVGGLKTPTNEKKIERKRLPRRALKADKLKFLDEIWNENKKITNIELRKQAGMGSKIVNDFLKSKKLNI